MNCEDQSSKCALGQVFAARHSESQRPLPGLGYVHTSSIVYGYVYYMIARWALSRFGSIGIYLAARNAYAAKVHTKIIKGQ